MLVAPALNSVCCIADAFFWSLPICCMLTWGRLLQIKDLGCKAGVVLNPGTSLTAIEEVTLQGRIPSETALLQRLLWTPLPVQLPCH
jgi:hypothetical protein